MMARASPLSRAVQVAAWAVLMFLILPIPVVMPVSLTDTSYISLPRDGLSMQHYINFFTSGEWLAATWHSMATGLGTAFAIGCWFLSDRAATLERRVLIAPILVPPVVQSLGFYRFWVQLGLIDTYTGVVLAHTLLALAYITISVFAALANLDRRLPQAARSCGASVRTTVAAVVMQAARPGMITGGIFAFIVSFDEIVGVLFITVRRVTTLPKMIWEGFQDNIDPTIAAVATVLAIATLIATAAVVLRKSCPDTCWRTPAMPPPAPMAP